MSAITTSNIDLWVTAQQELFGAGRLYSSYRLPAPPIPALTGEQAPRIPLPNNPDESLPSIRISADI
jgi:hypothetical protein